MSSFLNFIQLFIGITSIVNVIILIYIIKSVKNNAETDVKYQIDIYNRIRPLEERIKKLENKELKKTKSKIRKTTKTRKTINKDKNE